MSDQEAKRVLTDLVSSGGVTWARNDYSKEALKSFCDQQSAEFEKVREAVVTLVMSRAFL